MKVPNARKHRTQVWLSLSRLQNEGSQLDAGTNVVIDKSIKATE